MPYPVSRSRTLLSSYKPALAAVLGLCLLAACKSVPAIDPGKPPAMDPSSVNTTPPASVSAAQNLGDVIVGLRAPTDSAATLQGHWCARHAARGLHGGAPDVGRLLGSARRLRRCVRHAGQRHRHAARRTRHRLGGCGSRTQDSTLIAPGALQAQLHTVCFARMCAARRRIAC
jgi:hypothetical protein